ncbi:MAG: hypothetical protein WCO31_06325, partial [Actinomycetes bacterium]
SKHVNKEREPRHKKNRAIGRLLRMTFEGSDGISDSTRAHRFMPGTNSAIPAKRAKAAISVDWDVTP